jgi:hypothetical protein
MQFTIATIFFAIFLTAVILASIAWPVGVARDLLTTFYMMIYGAALVVALNASGRLRTVCFAFAIFGILLTAEAHPCPDSLAIWIKHNLVHPTARQELGNYHYSIVWVMNCHLAFVISVLAATISRYLWHERLGNDTSSATFDITTPFEDK